jgi:hypothetical protein
MLRSVFLSSLCCIAALSSQCFAFSALISPPRIEEKVKSGQAYRSVLDIQNVSDQTAVYQVQSNDWSLDNSGGVVFSQQLASDSCRPWVAIESDKITLGAGARTRFRFQVEVPANAGVRQCRFALMFEGEPEQVAGVSTPVAGRIGVIVYLDINGAQPLLQVVSASTQLQQKQRVPALLLSNTGTAHGRLSGLIDAVDSTGKSIALAPSADPILPGTQRTVILNQVAPRYQSADTPLPDLNYPLHLKGSLDTLGKTLDIDIELVP